jgi:hypothetical protein
MLDGLDPRFRIASTALAHPRSTAEVSALISEARLRGRGVRVWGSGHSVDAAIGSDDPVVPLLLDRLREVVITPASDRSSAQVEVGAGCHLGYHLHDPTGTSSWDNSLTQQLERAGFALDSLGGISHQTVGGFLATCSAGGSLVHDVGANVVAFELVDGRGRVHHVRHDADSPAERDLFEAAGVSMGLLGVITRVWLRAVPSYDVIGREICAPLGRSPIDLFGRDGRPGLVDLFRRHDYSRALWWPQQGFDRMQVWTGDRARPRSADELRPFEILGRFDTLLGALLQTLVGNVDDLDVVLRKLDRIDWFSQLERALRRLGRHEILHRPDDGRGPLSGLSPTQARRAVRLLRHLLRALLTSPISPRASAYLSRRMAGWVGTLTSWFVVDGEKHFVDRWHLALPMDNQLDDRLWPTAFAEFWLPLDHADEVMRALQEVVNAGGDPKERYRRVGAFPIEIYPGPPSRFWLSPGYRRPGLRVNPCRFEQWKGEPSAESFARFIDVLRPFDARPHWGKHLPHPDAAWTANLQRQLPRLSDFLRLRRELDPDEVFLTSYWRRHLGIEGSR